MSNNLRFEYRVRSSNEHAVDYGKWYPWEEVDIAKATEIQAYIDRGKDQYQLRVIESRPLDSSEINLLRKYFD